MLYAWGNYMYYDYDDDRDLALEHKSKLRAVWKNENEAMSTYSENTNIQYQQ